MVLLTFALLGISALAWSGAVKDAKASSADRRIRNAGYNLNRDFENVLRACHVKRKSKDGVKYLPENGWKSCVSYVRRQPYTTEKDVEKFITHYEKVRQKELANVSNQWEQEYEKAHREYLSNPKSNRESRNFMLSLMSNLSQIWLMNCMRRPLWVIWLCKDLRLCLLKQLMRHMLWCGFFTVMEANPKLSSISGLVADI